MKKDDTYGRKILIDTGKATSERGILLGHQTTSSSSSNNKREAFAFMEM